MLYFITKKLKTYIVEIKVYKYNKLNALLKIVFECNNLSFLLELTN